MVERVVDLHGLKMTGVVGQLLLLRDIPGVEDLLPVIVVVARGSDPELSSFGMHASVRSAAARNGGHPI